MNEIIEYLNKCKIFYLATLDEDQPRVRPFGIAEEFEGKMYIQTGKIKNVSKQLSKNPKIEICACDGPTWIRIEAEAINDDRYEAKKFILDKHSEIQAMYKPDDDNTQVLYLVNVKATFYSFTDKPREVLF